MTEMESPLVPDQPETGYFPSREQLALIASASPAKQSDDFIQFAPGKIARTDGLPVDETLHGLVRHHATSLAEGNQVEAERAYGLLSRLASVSDLTESLYEHFSANINSIAHWYPALYRALVAQGDDRLFSVPETTIAHLPMELAQFIRIEYHDSTPASKEVFNEIIFDLFGLKDEKTYFIKTGTFSSKFEFANARCAEPREMGEYFQVVNNFAMQVGAGDSVDLCVRDYIEPEESSPTIYHGMPLRTEFRAFVDLDTDEVLGITPYWHPSVMRRALTMSAEMGMTHLMDDAEVYEAHLPRLTREFEARRDEVVKGLEQLIPSVAMTGTWSIDVMLDRGRLYLIDMSQMHSSALVDVLFNTNEYARVSVERLRQAQARPEVVYPQSAPLVAGTDVAIAHPFVQRYPALD